MAYREPPPPGPTVSACYRTQSRVSLIVTGVIIGLFGLLAMGLGSTPPRTEMLAIGGGMLVLAVLIPLVMRAFYVRVEVNPSKQTMTLINLPFRSRRVFPLSRVKDVVVETDVDDDATRYRISLVVEGEAPVPLYDNLWVPGEKLHVETAAAIRALLPRPPEEP
jgi:hypothetical protein